MLIQPVSAVFHRLVPTSERFIILIVAALLLLPINLAAESLIRRGTFWVGVGTPGSVVPSEDTPYNPGPEWRSKWATLDVKQANDLLDKIGLSKKDSEGYWLRTDNGQRLRLDIMTVGGFATCASMSQLALLMACQMPLKFG